MITSAAFETDVRRERQAEGIAKAKGAGVYKGRKPSINSAEVRALKQNGRGVTEIASELGISRQSVYRALGGAEATATALKRTREAQKVPRRMKL